MSITEYLQQSVLFSRLAPAQVEQTAKLGREVVYSAGDLITCEGDSADEVYIVCRGMVEVDVSQAVIPDVPGPSQATYVARLGQGQLFGEMGLVARGTRSATVRCAQDGTIVLAIPSQEFWSLCDSDHQIGYVLMHNIAVDLSHKLYLRNLQA